MFALIGVSTILLVDTMRSSNDGLYTVQCNNVLGIQIIVSLADYANYILRSRIIDFIKKIAFVILKADRGDIR